VKRYVAPQFKEFFKDFPDLQESVINAVYDLCEDGERDVSIALVAMHTVAHQSS
jgi:hypothetical protein